MLKNKIHTELFDQNSDTSLVVLRKLSSLLENQEFGEEVWQLGNARTGQEKTASTKKYAFPELSVFPVDSPEETILSKVYFEGQRTKLAEDLASTIDDRLNTYIDLYDIPDAFAFLPEKTASAADFKPRHLLPSAGLYKVATVKDLDAASKHFEKNIRDYSLPERVEFSKEFSKVATTIRSQKLPKSVQTYCGVMETDFDNVKALLGIRKVAARRAGKSGIEYDRLASAISDVKAAGKDELEKLAMTIHAIDNVYGFSEEKYDKVLPDAYASVFNKEAEEGEGGEDPDATTKQMTKEDIIAQYGEDAIEALENEDGDIDYTKLQRLIATKPIKD